jgi:hypothetical protein
MIFTIGFSARDLVAMPMRSWSLTICIGRKIATYLSDISGPFDRTFVPYLLAKLQRCGVGETFLKCFADYLAARHGQVLVQGAFSDHSKLQTMFSKALCLGLRFGTLSSLMCPSQPAPAEATRPCSPTTCTCFENSFVKRHLQNVRNQWTDAKTECTNGDASTG